VSSRYERAHELLTRHMRVHGLKLTRQREVILQTFLDADKHVAVDDLLALVRRATPTIGHATVYRTMKLFVDAEIAEEHNFSDGASRYEPALGEHHHHDHLICRTCGRIVEFENEEIERLQREVAKGLGFGLIDHRMELYGDCQDASCSHRPT
jgi:Fur family ferric uptake transcriptional regulator